jgi:cyclic pyranopterin phosphate synthase
MPTGIRDFVRSEEFLDAQEIARIAEAMAHRGLHKVRLTGGEPLLRSDIIEIAARIAAVPGIRDLAISTNALLLKEKAKALGRAGVRRVNISLDSLDPVKFARVTGCTLHKRVLSGIYAALEADLRPVKINIVALPDLDHHELEAFILWASRHHLDLRFVEEMPFGAARGYGPDNDCIRTKIESLAGPLEALPHDPLADLRPPCRIAGEPWRITFISPMSSPFCAACNRVRLTARGFLKYCLDEDHGIDLKPLVLRGDSSEQLGRAIAHAVFYEKPERHHFTEPGFARSGRAMSTLGG